MVELSTETTGHILNLERLFNVGDYRAAASRRLPRPIFDIIDGGAGDEISLKRNVRGFQSLLLRPRSLSTAGSVDTSTTVLGESVSMPLLLAPTAYQRIVHRDAELAVARAAGSQGTLFALSSITSYDLERVAEVATGPAWFQLYLPLEDSGRDCLRSLLDRIERVGFAGLCVTLDTSARAIRERDLRNRMGIPLRLSPRLLMHGASRPAWALDFLRGSIGQGTLGFSSEMIAIKEAGRMVSRTTRPVTAEDLRWIRSQWSGPLIVKGVLRGDDCPHLLRCGVDGIVVSNHGGRQLDSVPAGIEVLPEIVEAVDGRAEVFLDGGVRRGVDVAKALALGARACLIGRPYLYALALAGEQGVRRLLGMYQDEIQQTMMLLGCASIEDLDTSFVRYV